MFAVCIELFKFKSEQINQKKKKKFMQNANKIISMVHLHIRHNNFSPHTILFVFTERIKQCDFFRKSQINQPKSTNKSTFVNLNKITRVIRKLNESRAYSSHNAWFVCKLEPINKKNKSASFPTNPWNFSFFLTFFMPNEKKINKHWALCDLNANKLMLNPCTQCFDRVIFIALKKEMKCVDSYLIKYMRQIQLFGYSTESEYINL